MHERYVAEKTTPTYLSVRLPEAAFKSLLARQNHLIIFINGRKNTACLAHNAFCFTTRLDSQCW